MNGLVPPTHTGRLRENYSPNYIFASTERVGWWEPQQVTIATGVSSWIDIWGANNLGQATGADQPTYSDSGGPNSGPALVFDGTSDFVVKTSASGPGTNNFDAFMLVKRSSWVADKNLFYIGNAGGTSYFILRQITTPDTWRVVHYDGAEATASTATGANDGNWHLVRCYYDGAVIGISIDGGAATTTADVQALGSKDRIEIGAALGGNFAGFSSTFALVINTVGTLAQRVKLTRYVNQRWPAAAIAEPSA